MSTGKPLIVQSDRTILLEVAADGADAARASLAVFAELEKSPEHIHTYRISPLSLWNAAAAGTSADTVLADLEKHAKYGVPPNIITDVRELMGRFGKLRLVASDQGPTLEVSDPAIAHEIESLQSLKSVVTRKGNLFIVNPMMRGMLKQRLARLGYPVDDKIGFTPGAPLAIALRKEMQNGTPFAPRPYQLSAVQAFAAGASHGVIVLPCGAGKTIVGMAAAAAVNAETLILCTNIGAGRQWISELLDKTTLTPEQVGEYSGKKKEIRPVTIATYNILSRKQGERYPHFELFSARDWGLIIYDEVHLLPAPVFRITADLQARRRLGLTATLVREDGAETDVFSLIGPKRFEVNWKVMEKTGFIAEANCHEVRVAMPGPLRMTYAASVENPREQYRLAATNPEKDKIAMELVAQHQGEGILVIGQYLQQLERLAKTLQAPLITGATPEIERERLYGAFRRGEERLLVVSKVANFSIDLPDASVCIQVSGTFGSRQEEAQRLGRILRPKAKGAFFYSLVSRDSIEMRFAYNRQLFLTEQGYRYYIDDRGGPRGDAGQADPMPMAPLEPHVVAALDSDATEMPNNVIPFRPRAQS